MANRGMPSYLISAMRNRNRQVFVFLAKTIFELDLLIRNPGSNPGNSTNVA